MELGMKIAIFAALVAILSISLPAGAASLVVLGDTAQYGGPGGGDFREACGDQEVMSGINVTVGKDINSISIVCQQQKNGVPFGYAYNKRTWGNASDDSGNATCIGTVVQGIYVATSSANILHHLELVCRDSATGATSRSKLYHDHPNWKVLTHAGESARTEFANCGSGAFAVGLFGGYGSHVDRLGIICAKIEDAAPAAPVTPQKPIKHSKHGDTTPAPSGDPLVVINDGNGGGGGGNQTATAATDTTIYDEPEGQDVAYISAGDPVTIIGCNDDNWCRISAPHRGWVWGEDLNR
jgi:hypothetical protein